MILRIAHWRWAEGFAQPHVDRAEATADRRGQRSLRASLVWRSSEHRLRPGLAAVFGPGVAAELTIPLQPRLDGVEDCRQVQIGAER